MSGLVEIALVVVLVVLAIAAITIMLRRAGRISMRTLVFVIPLAVAIAMCCVRELTRSRARREALTRAGVQAEFSENGLYGRLNRQLVANWGEAFQQTFPSDICALEFELDAVQPEELIPISFSRVQEVRMYQVNSASSTAWPGVVKWLNHLPSGTHVRLECQAMLSDEMLVLSELDRPLDELTIAGGAMVHRDLDVAMAIPTRTLVLLAIDLPLSAQVDIPPSRSNMLELSSTPAPSAIQLAGLKKCSSLKWHDARLTLDDCYELAALPELTELELGEIESEHLNALLTSKSLKALTATVGEFSDNECRRIEASVASQIKLRLTLPVAD